MKGVEEFVSSNFVEHDSTFFSCINLIIYGHSLLEKVEKYSRTDILNLTSTIRGKAAKKVELEDYLRNDLITKYIEPNRNLFGLDFFQFHSGVEEFNKNIKTGILDIKVSSPLWNGETYFIFECKRLSKELLSEYLDNGVNRFVTNQYYPHSQVSLAGMISFLESNDSKHTINYTSSFTILNNILKKNKKKIKLFGNLSKVVLKCSEFEHIQNFEYVYLSSHNRGPVKKPKPIKIYHIILDYNTIVVN